MSETERFWAKVERGGGCWNWRGATRGGGYGGFWRGGTTVSAHRVAYELANGPIEAGAVVMHTCDNRLCCNPDHLQLGSQSENLRDMKSKGRRVNPDRVGANHHLTRLTDDDVRTIIHLRGLGVRAKTIGKDYGISKTAVDHIVSKRTWKHVDAAPSGKNGI